MNNFYKKGDVIFSGVLLIAFFLPWTNIFFVNISGYQIPNAVQGLFDIGSVLSDTREIDYTALYLSYALYTIPVLSIIIIIAGFTQNNTRFISIILGICVFVILIYAYNQYGDIVFKRPGIGLILTMLSSACLLITSIFFKSVNSDPNTLEHDNIIAESYRTQTEKENEELTSNQAMIEWLEANPSKTLNDYYAKKKQ